MIVVENFLILPKIQGVLEIHELHIWQLVGRKLIGTVHVKLKSMDDYERVIKEMKKIFHKEGIHSSTIQPEFVGVRAII